MHTMRASPARFYLYKQEPYLMSITHESGRPLRVGLLKAHPDDEFTQALFLDVAIAEGWEIHQQTLTTGYNTTLDYSLGTINLQNHGRLHEEAEVAEFLRIITAENLYGTDGGLIHEINLHVPEVARWIGSVGIDLLVTVGGLIDHPDHIASGIIGRDAARIASRPVAVLELQWKGGLGDTFTPGDEKGQELAFEIASRVPSQFQVSSRQEQQDWMQVPGGFYVSPSTYADLSRYPVGPEGATYRYYAPRSDVALAGSTADLATSTVY